MDLRFHQFKAFEEGDGVLDEQLCFGGELHASARFNQQWNPCFFFKEGQLLGDCGGGVTECAGYRGDGSAQLEFAQKS
ncbi:hypothetical protein GCM10009655_07270 [Rhodoglobus aureus]|uniref:Uncharacterized protein n=1 Tax=Rhodoglobus aureus TaxID=191497 RepID=A0ABP4G207_9MICO